MRRLTLLPVLFVAAALVLAGCASTAPRTDAEPGAGEEASAGKRKAVVGAQQARVFVEGEDKGITPATIRVKRGFGETQVTLHVSGKMVRKYEVERVSTVDGLSMAYSYWGDQGMGGTSFDVQTLPTRKDGTVLIPFSAQNISVEDRQYDLTLVVEN